MRKSEEVAETSSKSGRPCGVESFQESRGTGEWQNDDAKVIDISAEHVIWSWSSFLGQDDAMHSSK